MHKGPDKEVFKQMSLGDHLEELRYRLILAISGAMVGLIACLFFGKTFLNFLGMQFAKAMEKAGMEPQLQAIKIAEKFTVYLKTSLVLGLIITCPWVLYHIWQFVSSGLYRHERKFVYAVVPACSAGLQPP